MIEMIKKISIPTLMILVTLFSILILILIDPIASAYIYFALNKKGSDFDSVNFTSPQSYKTAIEVLEIVTFIYLVKTDAGFIDKFIKFLEILKSSKNAILDKISKKEKKHASN